jgi:hypothetical protein
MENKPMNITINPGEVFFSDSLTIAHGKGKFVFDFKQSVPRFNPSPEGGEQPQVIIKHGVVVMDAELAKKLHELLGENIAKYEKEFGKVKLPKEEKVKAKKERKDHNNYIG